MWPVRETQSTHSIQHAARCLFQCDPVASEVAPDTPATPPADSKYLQHLYSYLVSSHPLTTLACLWLTLYPSSSPHYPLETFYPIKRQAHFHLSYSHELRSEMIYSSHVRISYILNTRKLFKVQVLPCDILYILQINIISMPNYSLQRTVTSQQSSIFPYCCLSLSIPTAVYSLTSCRVCGIGSG